MKPTWRLFYSKKGFGARPEFAKFVKKNHYSKTLCRGTKYIFAILEGDKIIGVAAFGTPVGRNCQGKYSTTGKPILELKRLCLVDDTPKNSESWFIARCLTFLKKTGLYDGVLSYADPAKKHRGIIYKASNFTYFGTQKQGSTMALINGKRVSAASSSAKKLFAIGESPKLVYSKPKHIFYYGFKR